MFLPPPEQRYCFLSAVSCTEPRYRLEAGDAAGAVPQAPASQVLHLQTLNAVTTPGILRLYRALEPLSMGTDFAAAYSRTTRFAAAI